MLTSPSHITTRPPKRMRRWWREISDFMRFPFNNFTYYLTLFSKFFSSFPHGTCSLSVSHQYLALDGIYHLLCAAFPNNATQRKRVVHTTCSSKDGSVTLHAVLFQGTWLEQLCWHRFDRLQFATQNLCGDFKLELFPLHSPLLGESLLVSFPPLINMLKFSG